MIKRDHSTEFEILNRLQVQQASFEVLIRELEARGWQLVATLMDARVQQAEEPFC